MKTKTLFLLLAILFSFASLGQPSNSGVITIENGKIMLENSNNQKYYISELLFTEEFDNQSIVIKCINDNVLVKHSFAGASKFKDTNYLLLPDSLFKKLTVPFTITINEKNSSISDVITLKKVGGGNGTQYEDKVISTGIFPDALLLRELLRLKQYDTISMLLFQNYFKDSAELNENPFIIDVIKKNASKAGIQSIVDVSGGIMQKVSKTIGNLDVTNLADGMAQFIVERTKQELSIAFFDRFKEELLKEENKDFRDLFPCTYRTFDAIGAEIYMFNAYLRTLQASFQKDLAGLPNQLPVILRNHPEIDKISGLKTQLAMAFYFAQSVQLKMHPGQIMEGFNVDTISILDPNIRASLQTIKLFSFSLKKPLDKEHYWYSKDEISQLYSDPELFKIYLGLVYQVAKKEKISFSTDSGQVSLNSLMAKDNNIANYQHYIREIEFLTSLIRTQSEMLNMAKTDSAFWINYRPMMQSLIQMVDFSGNIKALPFGSSVEFSNANNSQIKKIGQLTNLSVVVSDIVFNVKSKDYSLAIVNTTILLNHIDTLKKVSPVILKYGTFMANMAQAKSSAEVKTIIETIALPAGSARIKRETKFNVSLNAYCGMFYGYEHIKGLNKEGLKPVNLKFKDWNSYGVSAPIGIAMSWGHCSPIKNRRMSSSIFLSAVDIGALASFRFSNDSAESVPSIQLKDIVSPGVFYSMGIPKSPISVNVGYQVGPLLRKVNLEENTYGSTYSRFSVSVLVDIPLLNFYTSSK